MRPSRSSGRATLTRERRGSVIVWVGALVVVVVAFGAIAVDFSSFYTTASELQSAVDAGALAGAQRYQLSKLDDRLADARGSAKFVANKNRILGDTATIQDGNIKLVRWDEASATVLAVSATVPGNAIQVVDTTQTSFIFGWVLNNKFGRVAPAVRRGAVAWTANVSGATCIRPLGFSMSLIYRMLGKTPVDGPLTEADVEAFNKLSEAQRTFASWPIPNGQGQVPYQIPNWPGYSALALTGQGGGVTEYQKYLGGSCQQLSNAIDLNDVYDQPSANSPKQTQEIFDGSGQGQARDIPPLCTFVNTGGNKDQTCYKPGSSPLTMGITFPTAFGIPPGEFGRNNFKVSMLADVTIQCFVRGQPGGGNNAGSAQPGATCGTSTHPFNNVSQYTQGTIIGVIHPNLGFKAGEVKFSDVPSISRSLILVQ